MIMTKEMAIAEKHIQSDLWETPDYIFKPLNEIYNFTLDPCCFYTNAKAKRFFTPNEDGLKQSWAGETVFVNPPYSRGNIDLWVSKCLIESKHAEIIALLPVSTSSKWFHNYVWNKCEITFLKGRVRFRNAKHTAPFSSMICHFKKAIV